MTEENTILETLDSLRRKKTVYQQMMYIFMVLAIGMSALLEKRTAIIFILIIVGVVVCGILFYNTNAAYKSIYKQMIAKPVLESVFENVRYDPLNGITPEEFKQFHLIRWRMDFRYNTENLIQGTYQGIKFLQADIHIEHYRTRVAVTDIKGRLLKFSCQKNISGSALIVTKNHKAKLETGLHKVKTEDVEFNAKFDVYALDEQSASDLLTPQFVERIKRVYGYDDDIYIHYDRGKVYFLHSGAGGVFEPPKDSLDIEYERKRIRYELEKIEKVIDIFQFET